MSVIYKNGQYYGQEGGGSASFPPGGDAGQALIKNSGADDDVKWGNPEEGRAKSSAIAPVFDEEATYAEGDRVTYEDELYVFNKAHTGAWDSADADKSDVDSEIPDAMSASDLADVKAAFAGMNKGAPLRMMNYSTEEQVVGTWIDGKPLYQKTVTFTSPTAINVWNNHTVLDSDCVIVSINAYLYGAANGLVPLPGPYGDTLLIANASYVSSAWSNTNGTLAMLTKANEYVNVNCIATLQYTKTTD